jgi:hypothetical protein
MLKRDAPTGVGAVPRRVVEEARGILLKRGQAVVVPGVANLVHDAQPRDLVYAAIDSGC